MSENSEFPTLNAIEARVLGCLVEKKEATPDIYPLTLNAALAAATQKTSREPVMVLEASDIQRAFSQLEQKGLVRRVLASRVERYEHLLAQRFSLTQPQIVIVGLLMLRGPQTLHELLSRGERMVHTQTIDDVRSNLDLLIGRRPPLVIQLERAPGQREERYAHLLCGEVAQPEQRSAPIYVGTPSSSTSALEERLQALEEEVAELRARIDALGL